MSVPSTAIVVTPFHKAYFTRGDDGKDHVEYDLLVTNVFTAPVTLRAIEVVDAAGKSLMRVEGNVLAEATQTLFEQKPVSAIGPSSSAAVEIDLILDPGTAPSKVSHRISYDFPANAPAATIVGLREVVGPVVEVDASGAITIASPLSGPGWPLNPLMVRRSDVAISIATSEPRTTARGHVTAITAWLHNLR